jgi:hypothetical protein
VEIPFVGSPGMSNLNSDTNLNVEFEDLKMTDPIYGLTPDTPAIEKRGI